MTNIKTVEEVANDFASLEPQHQDIIDALTTIAAEARAEERERIAGKLLVFYTEIPEAYGWGKEDDEADRGFRICSKNVKAELSKFIQKLMTPKDTLADKP